MPSNRAQGQLYLIFPDTELKGGLCNGAAVYLPLGREKNFTHAFYFKFI